MVRASNENAALAAVDRILSGVPARTTDTSLLDRNLLIESGLSRATLYRCTFALERWRAAKIEAVKGAIKNLQLQRASSPTVVLTDADLIREARIEFAALRKLPCELLVQWEEIKQEVAPRQGRKATLSADQVVQTLASKLYAASLVIRQRDEQIAERDKIIAAQNATIARLGDNVIPLSHSSASNHARKF